MHKRVIEITVGFFFLFAIIALTVLALQVSGLSDIYHNHEGYYITADFENVGGLKPKARVSMAGVPIGRVVKIQFDDKQYLARVNIMLYPEVKNIPNDSVASILTAGLLGDNYIGMTPGFSEDFFKNGDHISVEQTNKAIVLEDLVSKLVANKASGLEE